MVYTIFALVSFVVALVSTWVYDDLITGSLLCAIGWLLLMLDCTKEG
jgi:hypothetical protein